MEKTIAIVGFGNQGEPWALNLRDSGWDVRVLVRPESKKEARAAQLGFKTEPLDRIGQYPIVALLIPDDAMPRLYGTYGRFLQPGQSLVFAHGFTLHYKTAPWPNTCDRILVAPKGIGAFVRERFTAGSGVPAVLCVENDFTKKAWTIARDVADGIGAGRAGTYEATVREEVEADLFSEQALLCGGLPALVAETYDILVKNGVKPEVAYLECVHELAFIADLFQKRGIHATLRAASPTAQFGGFRAARRMISPALRKELEEMFSDIRKGDFGKELAREADADYPQTHRALSDLAESPVETAGRTVRKKLEGRSV